MDKPFKPIIANKCILQHSKYVSYFMISKNETLRSSKLQETQFECLCTKLMFILILIQLVLISKRTSTWNKVLIYFLMLCVLQLLVLMRSAWHTQTHFCSRHGLFHVSCFFMYKGHFKRKNIMFCAYTNICGQMCSIFYLLDNFMPIKEGGKEHE